MNTVKLNGVAVYPFRSEEELLDYAFRNLGILVAINAEKILNATPETRAIINRNIGYCDGVGVILALKRNGYDGCRKIPGCELWLKIVQRSYEEKTFYLIGGKQEVIEKTVGKLETEFPGIRILGHRDGYIRTDEEKEALIDDIVAKKPDIVFVAIGSPRQEFLMEEIRKRHDALFMGLGGSFDVYTGHAKRAPRWWIEHNLEGLYRDLFSMSWYKFTRLFHTMPILWRKITISE